MTAQSSPTLEIESAEFQITSVSNGDLFFPTRHGLSPTVCDSGCWDGFICHFTVKAGRLFLDSLWINHGEPSGGWCRHTLPLPPLNGVQADMKYESGEYQRFHGKYDAVNLSLSYTGDVLISADYLSDEPRFHGRPWPWHFNQTFKLSFVEGALTAQKEVSLQLKTFEARYCTEGYLYGDNRKKGLQFLRRHIGYGFPF